MTGRVTLKPGEKTTPAYWVAKAAEQVRDMAAAIRAGTWEKMAGGQEAAAAVADAIAAYMETLPPTRKGQHAAENAACMVAELLTGEGRPDDEDDE